MDDSLFIPVEFNGQQMELPARVVQAGYTIKLEVEIDGSKVIFEPDEERNWRAVIPYEEVQRRRSLSTDLLRAIASTIDDITK